MNPSRSKSTGPRALPRSAERVAPTASEERLLAIGDIARNLHISRSLVYWLIQRGDLPTPRVQRALRFRPTDLQSCIQREPHDLEGVP